MLRVLIEMFARRLAVDEWANLRVVDLDRHWYKSYSPMCKWERCVVNTIVITVISPFETSGGCQLNVTLLSDSIEYCKIGGVPGSWIFKWYIITTHISTYFSHRIRLDRLRYCRHFSLHTRAFVDSMYALSFRMYVLEMTDAVCDHSRLSSAMIRQCSYSTCYRHHFANRTISMVSVVHVRHIEIVSAVPVRLLSHFRCYFSVEYRVRRRSPIVVKLNIVYR